MEPFDQTVPPELRETERRLRAERVTLDGFELDRLRRTITARAARGAGTRSSFLRSRMSIATMLTVGMLMSMSGAGLALNGASGDGGAASAQYEPETANSHTLCAGTAKATAAQSEDTTICSHTTQLSKQDPVTSTTAMSPSTTATTPTSHAPAQVQEEKTTPVVSAAEQVAAVDQPQDSGDTLPYTGYPALIVLIGGLLILSLGLVLRRQTRRESGV